MKKFELLGDIREIDPSEENKIIITTLDIVIERISKIHSFKSLFENIEYINYYPKNIENIYDYCYDNFKDFLEKNFNSISRVNMMGLFPPLFYWIIRFDWITIRLNNEQMKELLEKNYSYYKERIQYQYDNNFDLKIPLFYDLNKDIFKCII